MGHEPSPIEEEKVEGTDLETLKEVIEKNTKAFTEAHVTRDTALLNNSFTRDARVYPPHSGMVSGYADIATLNRDWVNYGIHEFREVSTNFYGCGDYLIDEGIYFLKYGEEQTIDRGKYINIWKKEINDWKIHGNMWNTSLP